MGKILKGGMGAVYICYNSKFEVIVALKTFHDKLSSSQRIKDSFKKEATAWIQLERHPNIVQAITFLFLNYYNLTKLVCYGTT
ncbi:MAG: hypothetical protein ACFFCM_04180 [Promethearchaeota archaeon]